MKVICNKREVCDEAYMCGGAVPHENDANECNKCVFIKNQKCEPVEVEKVLSFMGEKYEFKNE